MAGKIDFSLFTLHFSHFHINSLQEQIDLLRQAAMDISQRIARI